MNALDFLPFLGYSSVYAPLDNLLVEKDITWRPNVKRRLDTTYFVKGEGIVISFGFGVESEGVIPKSEGTYIFQCLTMTVIEENKKSGKYSGKLPEGLTATTLRPQIHKILGAPKRMLEEADNYFINDLVWTIVYFEDNISYLIIEVPTDGWRENGICP